MEERRTALRLRRRPAFWRASSSFSLELEETILSGEDHVADVEDVARFGGAFDLHEFFCECWDIHGAISS
jgi:hypothetical protein